jgi:hypothetical protein
LVQKLQLFWASLPHQAQAAIVVFATASFSYLHNAYTGPNPNFTGAEIVHNLRSALLAGGLALWAFYMVPSNRLQAPPAAPKA